MVIDASFKTGGQVDGIVGALVESLGDKQDSVCRAVSHSLQVIGNHWPNLVLSSCHDYLTKESKLSSSHKNLLFTVMHEVCKDSVDKLDKALLNNVCKTTIEEMTRTKEVTTDSVLCRIVIALGRQHPLETMELIQAKFQPGSLPHPLVLETLAGLALANPFGIMPFLKALLGTMLPMLSGARTEQLKWAMVFALGRFSEAIVEYLSNIEKAPDPSVQKASFATEIISAFDFLLANWLQAREAKVRAESAVTLGYMAQLLSKSKLEEQLPKLLPSLIALYRKQHDCFPVSKGLCLVLEAATEYKCLVLEQHVDVLNNSLFLQVCNPPDYTEPASVRNHNESLRCFTVLATMYPDRLTAFLLMKAENSNDKTRIGALTALKHIINCAGSTEQDPNLEERMRSIILGLQSLFSDPSNKAKKVLAQVIVALAHHGYLDANGGHSMVEFLVRQCALPDDAAKRPTDFDYVSNEALRTMCENVLQLLTTTVDDIDKIMWPSLFEYLLCEELTSAVGILCKCLANFASKKRDAGYPIEINYEKHTNVPKPQELLARLLVVLGSPMMHHHRGVHVLRLLRCLPALVHRNLVALWDTVLPQMTSQLQSALDNPENSLDREAWREQIVDLTQRCFVEVDKEEWTLSLGKAMQAQLSLYSAYPDDKCMLLQLLGAVMKKVSSKQFINGALDKIFEHINHVHPREREGCALAVGMCAASHLDAVVVKLEQVAKDDLRKNSGILSFLKDITGDSYHEKLLATVVLSYGHVSMRAPASILTTRIETPILRSAAKFYQASKDPSVRHAMLRTVKMIADAVHPDKLQEQYVFYSRGELVNEMQQMLKAENPVLVTSTTRSLVLMALASLVKLDPPLPPSEISALVTMAVSRVYPLPLRNPPIAFDDAASGDQAQNHSELVAGSLSALDQFLAELLSKDRTPDNLQLIIRVLVPWLNSKQEYERERCLNSIWELMMLYSSHIESGVFRMFNCFGFVLGTLVPRCTDSSISIRNTALTCIHLSLEINNKSQSLSSKEDTDFHGVDDLQSNIQKSDPETFHMISKELAKTLAKKAPSIQLLSLAETLLQGLKDPVPSSSSGAAHVLSGLLQLRGAELRAEVAHFVEGLHQQLSHIHSPQTQSEALEVVRTLAQHHSSLVVNALLTYSLPYDKHVCECWSALAKDPAMGASIVNHLLEMLDNQGSTEYQPDPKGQRGTIRVAVRDVLAAICALQEMFNTAGMESCAKEAFGQVFSALLLAAASYVGVSAVSFTPTTTASKQESGASPKLLPLRCALQAFEAFLRRAGQEEIVASMEKDGHWDSMEQDEVFPDSITVLAGLMCQQCPWHMAGVVSGLQNRLGSSPLETQRLAVLALFAELLSQPFEGAPLLAEPLMNHLLGSLADPSLAVRRLCLRSLAHLGRAEGHLVHRYSSTVLSAMISGLDDKDDTEQKIMLEAINGLATLLCHADQHDVGSFITTVALRLRPMFEKEKCEVRAAAFKLFGDLARFAEGEFRDAFVEQVISNVITLLVHLNEGDKLVVKACKTTLKKLGPLLGSEEVNNMFQRHLPDGSHLHYSEFISDLTKVMVIDLEEHMSTFVTLCLGHMKSLNPTIQCNAVLLLGCLLGNARPELRKDLPCERACSALVLLLKAELPEQRCRAAEALSLLHGC